ncbi:MAG: AI-2E family transporter, partial [Longicatena sp.]
SQLKRCIGLCILYLVITIIRNIAEPRIVGKQIGLHPLIMLACMYVGAKLFGFLGIFMLPICLLVAQHLYQKDPNNMALH